VPRKRHVRRARSSEIRPLPSPAAAPRQAARAGTLLLSEVRQPVQPAGARSRLAPRTLPARYRQPQHAAAPATPHPSTRSAPPRLKSAGPRKAGLVPAFLSPATNTPSYGARVREHQNRSHRRKRAAMLSRCAGARTCLASSSTTRSSESPIAAGPKIKLRSFDGWRGGGNNNFMSAQGAFQITFRGYRRAARAACPPARSSEIRPLPLPGGRGAASGASGNPFVI
jgi:hypothetical protein